MATVIIPRFTELELQIVSHSFAFKDLLVDMVCSRPGLRSLKVKSLAYDVPIKEVVQVQVVVEDLRLGLSCRPDLCIRGSKWLYGIDLELRSTYRS